MKKFLVVFSFLVVFCGFTANSFAAPMPLDGSWVTRDEVIGVGNFFTDHWEWTSSKTVKFDITDFLVVTDEYEVYDNGSFVFSTPALPDYTGSAYGGDWTNDPDVAWLNPAFSKGSWNFAAGSHDITIRAIDIPSGFSDSTVAFRATAVPEPATMLLFGIGLMGLAGVSRRKK